MAVKDFEFKPNTYDVVISSQTFHYLESFEDIFHKMLTTYINKLITNGFEITKLIEPEPDPVLLETIPEIREELRRAMMLLVSAVKK